MSYQDAVQNTEQNRNSWQTPRCVHCEALEKRVEKIQAELDAANKVVADLARIHNVDTAYLNQQ